MTCSIANNPTAQEYQTIEKGLDWSNATDTQQLEVMRALLTLVSSVKGSTPIYDWHSHNMLTGHKILTTALDKIEQLTRRIRRFESFQL